MGKSDARKLPIEVQNARLARRKAEQQQAEKMARAAKAQAKLKNQPK